MQREWQAFLTDKGARIEIDGLTRFDTFVEQNNYNNINVLCDLSHYGLICVSGKDASSFLQGQFSNDITQVDETTSQLSSYCNPKGRMLAIFRIFLRDGDYHLRLPRELVQPVLKRLQMFIMRADVKLRDVSDELITIGLTGTDAVSCLASANTAIPNEINKSAHKNDVTVLRVPGLHPRNEILGETEKIKSLWNQLEQSATAVSTAHWSWLDIQAGLPTVFTQNSEAFVPQMANLELVGGVNFKKGCYPGQEIIARMHYLGTLKRRMYLLHSDIQTLTLPLPGAEVYTNLDIPGQPSGAIVDAQHNPIGGVDALAVIKIEQATIGTLHLSSSNGPQYAINNLPYNTVRNN